MSYLLLQSRTPALVFEYVNNTDFKVSWNHMQCIHVQLHVTCVHYLHIYSVTSCRYCKYIFLKCALFFAFLHSNCTKNLQIMTSDFTYMNF